MRFVFPWNGLLTGADSGKSGSQSEYSYAAILSKSGTIYTGVCIDTCSTLGICAERNAIFNMITNGEQEIDKVICVLEDGTNGAPCGACCERMVQLMPETYNDIEIMVDYQAKRIVKLGDITPEWWI